MKTILSRDLLVALYMVGVLGALMQIGGGLWDVSWHVLGLAETFFTAPHTVLYAGIVSSLPAALFGLIIRLKTFGNSEIERSLLTGLLVALLGGGLQVIAGPIDFWWHDNFGFDPFLFTPPHSLLIVGIGITGLGMAIGSVRLLQGYRTNVNLRGFFVSSRWRHLLVIVSLTTLWLDLNTVVYLMTDVDGMAHTLRLCNDPVSCANTAFVRQTSLPAFIAATIILSATGTLVFFSAKSILGWTGAVTATALLSAAVSTVANLGFRASVLAGSIRGHAIASFIPLYISFVVPVFLFDLLVKNSQRKRTLLLASALISPFASFLDGWNALSLWTQANQLIPILIVPMIAAGLTAGLLRFRFANILLSERMKMNLMAGKT